MADYTALKVTELKDLLKARGIPSTGLSRKQQIVDALVKYDAQTATEQAEDVKDDQATHRTTVPTVMSQECADTSDTVVDEAGERQAEHDAVAEAEGEETGRVDISERPDMLVAQGGDVKNQDSAPTASSTAAAIPPSEGPVEASTEGRKRKRRSPTPPPNEDAAQKKPKVAVEAQESLPSGEAQRDATISSSGDATNGSRADVDETEPPSSTAIHPATRALYIRNLVRPLPKDQLPDHLADLCRPDSIETFHLDNLRTHAFIIFSSGRAAVRVRAALHDTVWPDEPTRKPLWVDFVPEAKVAEWMEKETGQGTAKRDARRWEVAYTTVDGQVRAELKEMVAPPETSTRRPSVSTTAPAAASNPPSNPSASFAPHRPSTQHSSAQTREPLPDKAEPEAASNLEPDEPSTFTSLDTRFAHTRAKPKLYYLPLPDSIAQKRRDALARLTSQAWDTKRGRPGDGGFEGQKRRYTFENGDRLVDGGVDWGEFGREGRGQHYSGGGGGARRGR